MQVSKINVDINGLRSHYRWQCHLFTNKVTLTSWCLVLITKSTFSRIACMQHPSLLTIVLLSFFFFFFFWRFDLNGLRTAAKYPDTQRTIDTACRGGNKTVKPIHHRSMFEEWFVERVFVSMFTNTKNSKYANRRKIWKNLTGKSIHSFTWKSI